MVQNTLKINEKLAVKYPKSIAFIISNEFCERFMYYGMRTILVLYLTRKLNYDDDTATVCYHIFTSMAYLFPLFGAIIADSWLGRYRTILYLSVVYCLGSAIIALGAIPPLHMPANITTFIGLSLIAIGTGGIKPCVSAFGGDQFKIPEQAKQLATFFSLFYFAINAGSMISTSVTPILREDVHCFNENHCFSLAFGVPGLLMILSIIIFIMGKSLYVIKKPSGNMIVEVSKCITEAVRKQSQEKKIAPREHWLDYAEPRFGKTLVEDTKGLLKILILYLPLPVFWALFDQQGSRWTFQATRMDGSIGGFTIKPDQMQVINPFLILSFIPLFDYAVYPLLAKIGIKRPLQKLTLGGLLAALAFGLSGFVNLRLEQTYPVLPATDEAQLRIFNGMPCDYHFLTELPDYDNFTVRRLDRIEEKFFVLNKTKSFSYQAIADNENPACPPIGGNLTLIPQTAMSYFVTVNNEKAGMYEYEDYVDKPKNGVPLIRILATVPETDSIKLKRNDFEKQIPLNETNLLDIPAGEYDVFAGDTKMSTVNLDVGGSYTLAIEGDNSTGYDMHIHIVTEPNTVHLAWQLPQYVILTAGEVMFSVTGLEFSFTQAPASMKSVLQACWLLTVAIGNWLVVLIAEFRIFESQAAEFFLFAFLMVLDMGIFIILAMRYKYIEVSDDNEEGNNLKSINVQKRAAAISNGHTNEAYIID